MKNNTKESKDLLLRALNCLPNDFALKEVKIHIRHALSKIENVEKKRIKRENNAIVTQQIENKKSAMTEAGINDPHLLWQLQNASEADNLIKTIDKMIEEEKKKLNKGIDDQDIQTIFG